MSQVGRSAFVLGSEKAFKANSPLYPDSEREDQMGLKSVTVHSAAVGDFNEFRARV